MCWGNLFLIVSFFFIFMCWRILKEMGNYHNILPWKCYKQTIINIFSSIIKLFYILNLTISHYLLCYCSGPNHLDYCYSILTSLPASWPTSDRSLQKRSCHPSPSNPQSPLDLEYWRKVIIRYEDLKWARDRIGYKD